MRNCRQLATSPMVALPPPPDVSNHASVRGLVSRSEEKQSTWTNRRQQVPYIFTRDNSKAEVHKTCIFFKGLESIISSGSIYPRHLFLLLVLMTKPVWLASFSATSRGLYGNERFLFDFLLIFALQRITSTYRTLQPSLPGQHFSPCPVLLVNISTHVQYAFVKIVFAILSLLHSAQQG